MTPTSLIQFSEAGQRLTVAGMTPLDVLDVHMTRLAGWLVQTVGRALIVGAVCFVVPFALGAGGYAAVVGLVGFALFLATADAPLPSEAGDDD